MHNSLLHLLLKNDDFLNTDISQYVSEMTYSASSGTYNLTQFSSVLLQFIYFTQSLPQRAATRCHLVTCRNSGKRRDGTVSTETRDAEDAGRPAFGASGGNMRADSQTALPGSAQQQQQPTLGRHALKRQLSFTRSAKLNEGPFKYYITH